LKYTANQLLTNLRSTIWLGMIFFSLEGLAQDSTANRLRKELHITVDNDALLFYKNDKYYSSGIFIKYRRLISEDRVWFRMLNKNGNLSKAIVSYDFVHKMYTAKDIDEGDESNVDRPYAGLFNANVAMNYHFKNNSTLIFEYDLGLLGPGTRTDDIQIWWHDFLNMKTPRGWQYQINNTIATNLSVLYQKRILKAGRSLDFITEQFAQVGTIRNNVRSGLTMRWGKFGSLDNTIYTYSKLGQVKKKVKDIPELERLQEFYFYINATIEHVFYNTTIEGNFVGEPSSFTKDANPWVFHHTWGFGRSGRLFDWRIALVFRSTEVKEASKHKYVGITLVQRF
jgi:lipid A 3-O-deacylase